MKILHPYHPNDFEVPERNVKISLNDKTLNLSWELETESKEPILKEVSVDLIKFAGGFVDIRCVHLVEPNTIVVSPGYATYSYANKLPAKSYSTWDIRQFCIMVNEDASDCDVLICFPTKQVDGFENIIPTSSYTWTGIITNFSVIGKSNFEKVQRKSKLLGELDNGNSIAYLEAQVDVLTRYVLNKHMNDIDDEELRAILLAANSHSVLDIKSKEKLIEEMEHKAHTRQEQLKYYERKDQ